MLDSEGWKECVTGDGWSSGGGGKCHVDAVASSSVTTSNSSALRSISQRVHELFDFKREDPKSSDLIDRGLGDEVHLTHVVHHDDKKEPNPAKPTRAMRKYRAVLQSLADKE